MFLLEKDGGEYSSFGMVCLNEGIKEILGKKRMCLLARFLVKLV